VASESALPVDQGDVYTFGPAGVTADQEVLLTYHNTTTSQVFAVFALLDANGQDLFVANNIPAASVVAPGAMATGVVPSNLILGAKPRAEVSGRVIVFTGPKPPPRAFSGPASLQIVDATTKKTLGTVGVIGPVEMSKYFGG
jgi:hypothetical protein